MLKILLINLFLILKLSKSKENNNDTIIDLTEYDYPKPIETEDEYNIAILGTNDIHGTYFPLEVKFRNNNFTYKSGGLDYLGKYISILREEWKDRFIWLDAGDQFQGGYENKLSNGSIITDFFNIMNLSAATFGNHEWDYERKFIEPLMKKSNFNYIISNIQEISSRKKIFLPNQKEYQIIKAGKINVGIIGLTTKLTKSTSYSRDVQNVNFLDYIDTIQKISPILRNQSDVIILLVHFGITCPEQNDDEKYTLKIINKTTSFSKCLENEELHILLENLPKGLIDVVVFGHTHEIYHQWLFDYPIISTVNNGKYTNIMYLSFKKNSNGKYEFNKDKTLIEGPIPICEKIFEKSHQCRVIKEKEIDKYGKLLNYKFHNKLIEKENKLKNLSNFWNEKLIGVRNDIIVTTEDKLSHKKRDAESIFGNLIVTMIQKVTNSDLSIINSGGFRTEWAEGNISMENIESMFPFSNNIVSFQMTGKEIKKMFSIIQTGYYAYYLTSGVNQIILDYGDYKKIGSIKLYDGVYEKEIENDKNYTIGTYDFLILYGGDDFKKILNWYTIKEEREFGDLKENLVPFLKQMKKIVSKNWYDNKKPRLRTIHMNNYKIKSFRFLEKYKNRKLYYK